MDGQTVRTAGISRLVPKDDNVVYLNDLVLVRAAQENGTTAERLLRRVQPKIFQVIRAVVHSDEEATEIGQLVALKVMEKLGSYRGEGSLEAWAGAIAYRVTMRSLKRLREWERRHVMLHEDDMLDFENPEKQISRQQVFTLLESKLNRIPTTRRTSLFLHLLYGYTVDEISSIMDVSPNTTKYRLKTSLRELRSILEKNPAMKEAMLEVVR